MDVSTGSGRNDAGHAAATGNLARALARSAAETISSAERAELADALLADVGDVSDYEASVRGSASEPLRSGRMMIERAAPTLFPAIAEALDVKLPASAGRWIDLALRERVPLIAGWDRRDGSGARCVKLYVNASDAGSQARSRLCDELAPDLAMGDQPAAVLGMNARADGDIEAKLYLQSADAVGLANSHGTRAQDLALAAQSEGADAGGVLSLDAGAGKLSPRAFFVALREPPEGHTWQCVRELPGYNEDRIQELLPFPPAPPRSVGVSLGEGSWTLYYKPLATMRAPQALEPTAIFRADSGEVGVFVEPNEHAERAFRRTKKHAVSIRIREGDPSPRSLEDLVDWFTIRLQLCEEDGADLATRLGAPPAPWTGIEATSEATDKGDKS